MFGILGAAVTPSSGVSATYEDLFASLQDRMEKEGYKVVKARSHRARLGGADVPGNDIIRIDLVCDRGGRPYKCQATKHKTSTKKTDCPWKAKAVNRKSAGGWVLTIVCDQHNHQPGTPEPPTPSEVSEHEPVSMMEDDDADPTAPLPDVETSAALQVAGVSDSALRLSSETFKQFKLDYRKMMPHERMQQLATLQLRIAALYAVQNEDMQRQRRMDVQQRRHNEIEQARNQPSQTPRRNRNKRNLQPEEDITHLQPPTLQPGLSHDDDDLANQLMQEPAFQLQQPTGTVAMGGMVIPQFEHYQPPPKRMRNGRQGQMASVPSPHHHVIP
ncbi:hypothetical protein VHEMI09332 [[Torrubiella] hemipterigena]|uniref:FAR1 domain-containing protein n=1 Tax=[Torrubiella] hemipterigena TaxID=1531966 RepID=A0A0A1TQ62_9HYPO|nr:hypothetical protein VHEMI09332 [[Torrubiella] hemipterigena]